MRLTTLLDTVNNGGSGPWPPGATAPDTLDQLVAELIPCRSNDPELWFAERTAEADPRRSPSPCVPDATDMAVGQHRRLRLHPDGSVAGPNSGFP